MRAWRTRASLGALTALAFTVALGGGRGTGMAAGSDPPALPAAASNGPATCEPSPAQARWTTLQTALAPTGGREPEYTVDPWLPCRWYRATDSQTIQRSVDGGASWQTVLRDTAAASGGAVFQASGLQVPSPGAVAVSESGNGDALAMSADAGRTWQLRDGGTIAGQPILDVVFAPSDSSVAYALPAQDPSSSSAYTAAPFVTRDGGRSWQQTSIPSGAFMADPGSEQDDPCDCLVVDPTDPSRAWLLVQAEDARNVLLTGTGFGQNWAAAPGPSGEIHQMLAVRSKLHPLRLLVAGFALAAPDANGAQKSQGGSQDQLMVSDDESMWRPVDAGGFDGQAPSEQVLAADPDNPDRMVMLRYRHHVETSTDGGDTWTDTDTTPIGHAGLDAPALHHVSHNPYDPGGMPVRMVLQPATDGTMYLTYTQSCASMPSYETPCPAGVGYIETWSRYAPPWVPVTPPAGGSGGESPTRTGTPGLRSATVEMTQGDEIVVDEYDSAGAAAGTGHTPLYALVRVAPDRLSADRLAGCAALGGLVVVSWLVVAERRRRWRRLGREDR